MLDSKRTVKMMERGAKATWSLFGMYVIDPLDGRCHDVHTRSARSLDRKGIITRVPGTDEFILAENGKEGE